jgi:hypothetical protein
MKKLLSILFLAVTAAVAVAQQGHAFRKVDIRAAYLHLKGLFGLTWIQIRR